MATASVSDVRGVIDTDLSDSEITNFIDDAEFDAQQAISNYSSSLTTDEKTQLEKYTAALYIRRSKDRSLSSTSRETASVSYDGSEIAWLEEQVDQRDPSGTLASQTDSNRYVNSGP